MKRRRRPSRPPVGFAIHARRVRRRARRELELEQRLGREPTFTDLLDELRWELEHGHALELDRLHPLDRHVRITLEHRLDQALERAVLFGTG